VLPVDLELLEQLLVEYLAAIQNPEMGEPVARSVFNVEDEALSDDPREHPLPAIGYLLEDEGWEDDEILGEGVAKVGRVRFQLLYLTDAPKYGAGMRGPRGAMRGSALIAATEDDGGIQGWEPFAGCKIEVHRRSPYRPRNENGERIPLAGMVIEASLEAPPLTSG
jgi:hypothetical protein